jgi:predicted ATPase
MLKSLTLLRERIADPTLYPFSVPAIASLHRLDFPSRVTFFTGENGSGKSSLLEAIALNYGLSLDGGNRNFAFQNELPADDTYPLARALRLGFFPARTGEGFFFRAETLFNFASRLDELDAQDTGALLLPPILDGYGGQSLHTRSHGETFFTVLDHKFRRSGLFLLDEPEAALSPQRQLSFLILIHQTLRDYKDAQFIVSTHSPILLGYPGAQILSFDDGSIHEISYEETAPMQIVRRFTSDRDRFLNELFREPPGLFDMDENE